MSATDIVCWQESDVWLGYLQDFPDYWTQGQTFDDLKEHLKSLRQDIIGGIDSGLESR